MQTDRSLAKKLHYWLQNWFKNHCGDKKLVKPCKYWFLMSSSSCIFFLLPTCRNACRILQLTPSLLSLLACSNSQLHGPRTTTALTSKLLYSRAHLASVMRFPPLFTNSRATLWNWTFSDSLLASLDIPLQSFSSHSLPLVSLYWTRVLESIKRGSVFVAKWRVVYFFFVCSVCVMKREGEGFLVWGVIGTLL